MISGFGDSKDYLDWSDRPTILKERISSAFDCLVENSISNWGLFNGSEEYELAGIAEYKLMKKIIQHSPSSCKQFYALDIGAGNFQWGIGLADYLEEQTKLPKDIKITIISIRGENNFKKNIKEGTRCTNYNFGAFKIEKLFSEFKKRGLDLENKIDLIVSSWCFRHLADPVGTFTQAYNLLRPQTGFFLIDGFYFLNQKETLVELDHNEKVTRLFVDIKAPFLTKHHDSCRSLNHFVLQRIDANSCRLPMRYKGVEKVKYGWQIGSNNVTRFKRESQELDKEEISLFEYNYVYGDKKIYEWLKQNGLFEKRETSWSPLFPKRNVPEFPLHQAIVSRNEKKIQECLSQNVDLNESDQKGDTALHLSIQEGNYELFQYLLSQGVHLGLSNNEGYMPLHQAARYDMNGKFLKELIQAKASLDKRTRRHDTPLISAIKSKNKVAIKILLKAGADIDPSDLFFKRFWGIN